MPALTYFNPRAPCGARPCHGEPVRPDEPISIHAPLAGCDLDKLREFYHLCISIHAPLAGCDFPIRGVVNFATIFQSTHPLRGATPAAAPCVLQGVVISIHAPLAGCDLLRGGQRLLSIQFQSTHPLRGATPDGFAPSKTRKYFNPRTPCGVRRLAMPLKTYRKNFNPRTPCGVRLSSEISAHNIAVISIHAPLAGCDFL